MYSQSPALSPMGDAQRILLSALSARTLPFRVFDGPLPVGAAPTPGPAVPAAPAAPLRRDDRPATTAAPARRAIDAQPWRETRPRRAFWRRWHDALLRWRKRAATRRAMLQMSDHILKDIGVSRAKVRLEVEKPFWRE